jgi:hypothetical protein
MAYLTELIYPTEFLYRYAIEAGHLITKAPGKLVDTPMGRRVMSAEEETSRAHTNEMTQSGTVSPTRISVTVKECTSVSTMGILFTTRLEICSYMLSLEKSVFWRTKRMA